MVKAENIALAVGGLAGLALVIYKVTAKPPVGAVRATIKEIALERI